MSSALKSLFVGLVFLGGVQIASAQPGVATTTAPEAKATDAAAVAKPNTSDNRYRIGPGDILEVRVARAPELSREAVRVDQSGKIRMPMLEEDIPAACLTEAELAQNVAKLYRKYKNNPHVDVFVKEFQSQPVAVIGAVKSPAQFKLQRQVRLLELISLVGGPSDAAGQTIQIVHAEDSIRCNQPANVSITDAGAFSNYNLQDTLRGASDSNPFVRPGDIVQVPQADQVFVLGNVLKPSAIPMKEPLTVSRAIALAGGTAPNTKRGSIRIIRQIPGSQEKKEIPVDLEAIEKNRAEDVALLPNDVVNVPISGAKSFLRSLLGAVIPTAAQLPVRVIP